MIRRRLRAAAYCALILLLLTPAGCSDTPAASAPLPSVMPTAKAFSGDFSIAFIAPSGDSGYMADTTANMGRMQKQMNDRGWKVRLVLKLIDFTQGEYTAVERLIRAESAAGSACDGYYVSSDVAERLKDKGLTLDPGDIVRGETPKLYARFKRYFDGGAVGLPACVRTHLKGYSAALFLPGNMADAAGIGSLSDALDWLERADPERKIGAYSCGTAWTPSLIDAWAGEQGYYPLSLYGMAGMMYASYADEACMPVPVEAIAGFQAFADRCAGLIANGRIVDYSNVKNLNDSTATGYIGPMGTTMDESFLIGRSRIGSDYAAYPLRGCGRPSLPREDPSVVSVIAIPSGSVGAGQVARLMEWAATDPDDYDLVCENELYDDFFMMTVAVKFSKSDPVLINGLNLPAGNAFSIIAPQLFLDGDKTRATVNASSSFAISGAVDIRNPPIWAIEALRGDPYACTAFGDIAAEMDQTIQARETIIRELVSESLGSAGRDLYAEEKLLAMKADTDALAKAYAARIRELMDEQKKG